MTSNTREVYADMTSVEFIYHLSIGASYSCQRSKDWSIMMADSENHTVVVVVFNCCLISGSR